MAELISFPNAQALVLDALNAALPSGVKAHPAVPKDNKVPQGREFVVVRALGGQQETFVSAAPLLSVEGYADSRARAYDLCDLALAIVRSQDGDIRGARGFSYPQELPDPTTRQIRYTSTGEVRVRGAAIPS